MLTMRIPSTEKGGGKGSNHRGGKSLQAEGAKRLLAKAGDIIKKRRRWKGRNDKTGKGDLGCVVLGLLD